MSLGKLIQKGRNDKGMTQKDLATKICEKPQVINEYEQGKGIPNNQILIKIEKAIGVKLRGKDKGTQPFEICLVKIQECHWMRRNQRSRSTLAWPTWFRPKIRPILRYPKNLTNKFQSTV